MSLDKWVELIHSTSTRDWNARATAAFEGLFGAGGGRYPVAAKSEVVIRAPEIDPESGVRYAAIIHRDNPGSGRYHGLSFVVFPADQHPCLIGLVVGTDGLSPDEAVLGRPGHARKSRAICDWLNATHGGMVAWSKQDPTRTDIKVPDTIVAAWPEHKRALGRYGAEVYAMYRPDPAHPERTAQAVAAFLDLLFEERGNQPVKEHLTSANQIRQAWFEHVMPSVSRAEVRKLLGSRRYVIVQGPPGTGKTRMAGGLLQDEYAGHGRSIQFHANTTYENFVGGLAPVAAAGEIGLRFAPAPGFLMESAAKALSDPQRNYLLHIDEINRADLGKVLGEAIYLLEPDADRSREIDLPYDFGAPFHRTLRLPGNLHIIGTMNSADRSIAILDVAVRRRFAFVSLWPSRSVVQGDPMAEAFERILSIFVEHAPDDMLPLMPGHSYFLKRESLQVGLVPLLEEYLAQGYVSGFAEHIRSYLQWLRALPN
ncbi:MAG: AAA family ATPase [Bryobacterales bacterium]|nr:AAA family ATPase [Bryobacterales bacterium]